MLNRLLDCIVKPRFIGKYHSDSFFKVLLTIFIFFCLYMGILAMRCFNSDYFSNDDSRLVASIVVQYGGNDISYNSLENKIEGDTYIYKGEVFNLVVLPAENYNYDLNAINIVLHEDHSQIVFYGVVVSNVQYQNLNIESFDFNAVANNDFTNTYNFCNLISLTLQSSNAVFQAMDFFQKGMTNLILLVVIALLCYFAISKIVNPSIDRDVRLKLVMYDACIFFVALMFAEMLNVAFLEYFGIILPGIYTYITFKHIVKVVIRR